MLEITPLFSGSSGNSIHIKYGSYELLIDAGVSCRSICTALNKIGSDIGNINMVLVTHEHSDHISGLETICKKTHMPVYINELSASYIRHNKNCIYLSQCLKPFNAGEDISPAEGLFIHAFKTPHDACGSVGYSIKTADDDSFSYATDIGYVTRDIARNVFGSKTVIFESNHDLDMLKNGIYPDHLKARILSQKGHLSNKACAEFIPHLARNGAKRIILAHLSKDNNTRALAYDVNRAALDAEGFNEVVLEVAKRSILDDET